MQDVHRRRRESVRKGRGGRIAGDQDSAMCRCGTTFFYEVKPNGRRRQTCDVCLASNRKAASARTSRRKKLRSYGMTEQTFMAMLNRQADKCAICRCVMDEPCVDHDHTSGQVRAILCHSCNRGIGLLADDPARLRSAADYVERHRSVAVA